MRIGKNNIKLAANLKTRRCVVLVKRMKTQPNKNNKRVVPAKADPNSLKSRPTGSIKSSPALSTSFKAKDRVVPPKNVKTPQQAKRMAAAATPVTEELPPTIAAGRSRRVHKPNPKYANEDILTPRSLKASAVRNYEEEIYTKSINDSDTEGTRTAKVSRNARHGKSESDSDFEEDILDSDASINEKTTRNRTVKTIAEPTLRRSAVAIANAGRTLNKTGPSAKATPTQLQQLRRTLNANNLSPLAMAKKRKLEDGSPNATSTSSNKRPNMGTSTRRSSSPSSSSESYGGVKRRQSQSNLAARQSQDKLDRKFSPVGLSRSSSVANLKTITANKTQQNALQRSIANRNSLAKASSTSTPSLSKTCLEKASNAAIAKSNLNRPAAAKKQQTTTEGSDVDDNPTITIDDFETMPTFTIVNINDIINKKGDVLISEASGKNKTEPASKPEPPNRNVRKQLTQPPGRPLSKRNITEGGTKNSSPFNTSTPLGKKTNEKAPNNAVNKMVSRSSTAGATKIPPSLKRTASPAASKPTTRSGTSEKKPAPRILNSVVSPRTKPIKPVIANLDISDDDPSGSVSIYTDDDEEEGVNDSKHSDSEFTGNESEVIESPKKRRAPQTKRPAATVAGKNKVGTSPNTATKENSAAANNCLPKKQTLQSKQQQLARKLSPEKVVVQREGNKIIKKITCFETWYVINKPPDVPEEYERNSLDMPLIDLANSAKDLTLPSEAWTTKVTLYELRKSMSKSNLTIYSGDLTEQNIKESDRANYQPSCVMFRRTVTDRVKLQLPYDRAVIFKNKTFFTNIEGKNVKLVGAPTTIKEISEVETLLDIVDGLTLQSPFVEPAATIL